MGARGETHAYLKHQPLYLAKLRPPTKVILNGKEWRNPSAPLHATLNFDELHASENRMSIRCVFVLHKHP